MTKQALTRWSGALRLSLAILAIVSTLGLAGCSPQPTATPGPTATPRPSPTPQPSSTPQPLALTVLHTNDILGYTAPCG